MPSKIVLFGPPRGGKSEVYSALDEFRMSHKLNLKYLGSHELERTIVGYVRRGNFGENVVVTGSSLGIDDFEGFRVVRILPCDREIYLQILERDNIRGEARDQHLALYDGIAQLPDDRFEITHYSDWLVNGGSDQAKSDLLHTIYEML